MAKAKINSIKPVLGFVRMSDGDLLQRLNKAHDGMWNNPAYLTPPVDMATFKTAVETYTAAVSATLEGGKSATAARDKGRSEVMFMLRQLGHYVEQACKNDMTTFLSSGFIVAAPKNPAQPMAVPAIASVDQGNPGELKVIVKPVARARYYEIRGGAVPAAGGNVAWTSQFAASTKPPAAFNNLNPGTNYTFQVRAFGTLGPSDWSAAANRMCI